ncbi:MAG: ATP-dependent zinc metalloprotease FtsH [Oscillospiraceae bacterium]|nr:ATP-dependent zinc metalloprotease FtsH [Oscillospiraceae bacterium]
MTGIVTIVLWALLLALLINFCTANNESSEKPTILYSSFRNAVNEDAVAKVDLDTDEYVFTLREGYTMDAEGNLEYTDPDESSTIEVEAEEEVSYATTPPEGVDDDELIPMLVEHNVEFGGIPAEETSFFLILLENYILPIGIMVVAMLLIYRFVFRRMGGGGMGGMGGVGKSNAKVYVEKKTGVTFKDVAGQDEAKESLEEIIDFLHNPQKYTEIGAKLPKGALLVGSPGTGKTLLARAVAGEANVPFFSISGSDFVEMFVGVGASRVRDLFKEAAKMAPCIIFIDEIDTIGKSRDNRMGGNDEREQTLNQLLAELDGFDPTKGVIVLAATNRPEVLDKALLRPGRFDRRIIIDRPNLAGRLATLQVHTRNIHLAEDVNLQRIAQATAGCVGADLANLVNEAALRAVRMGRKAVNQNDLLTSFEVVIAGTEKKGTVLTEKEKRLIAYHEVGHALVAAKQKNAQPVSKITIVPHTQGALGYTMQLPEEEKFLMTREDLLTEIRTLLAGRGAEELVFNTQTSGAANDIERATDVARKLVTMYGMSKQFGMMGLATVQNEYLEGNMGLNCAQDTAAKIDSEVQEIIETCHEEARNLLRENREMLDKIAGYLLEKETITGQEMMCILDGKDPALADDYTDDSPKMEEKRRDALNSDMEPPARHVHITNEKPVPHPDSEDKPDSGQPPEEKKDDDGSEPPAEQSGTDDKPADDKPGGQSDEGNKAEKASFGNEAEET